MRIQVAAIQFNNDQDSQAAVALKLRKNAFQTLSPVEWIRDINRFAHDSMVAYAISQVVAHSNRIKIRVKFRITDAEDFPKQISVRAIQPPFNLNTSFWNTFLTTHFNVLGEVSEKPISINHNGETDFINFELKNHKLEAWGVGIYLVIWNWQYKEPGQSLWKDFSLTQHKVYSILNLPTLPFAQDSIGDVLLPWTEILDHACIWAAGSKTEDEAATMITRKLFSLGPLFFEYNCVNFLPSYVQPLDLWGNSFFNCTNFLLHLKSNSINRFIICSDCAAIVSTFSNILGCDLWQSKMETPGLMFRVNKILAIGGSSWQTPCGVPGFAYHEVAWKGSCTNQDAIFDACLAVDGTNNPFDSFRLALLPVNILPGNRGSGLYRDKLVVPDDWNLSTPRPETRMRRMLVPGLPQFPFFAVRTLSADKQDKGSVDAIKEKFDTKKPGKKDTVTAYKPIESFWIDTSRFPDWEIIIQDLFEVNKENKDQDVHQLYIANKTIPRILHTYWRPQDMLSVSLVIKFYECPSAKESEQFIFRILSMAHVGIGNFVTEENIGDKGYSLRGDKNFLFSRNNIAVLISNAGRNQVPVRDVARQVDNYIQNFDLNVKTVGERAIKMAGIEETKLTQPGEPPVVNRWEL